MSIIKGILFFIVFCFLFVFDGNGQLVISYEEESAFRANRKDFNLYIDNILNRSMYIQSNFVPHSSSLGDDEIKKIKDQYSGKKVSTGNPIFFSVAPRNYFMYDSDSVLTTINVRGKQYLVNEPIPKMEWEIHNENKYIDSVQVQKAITSFRGRKYIAWFASQYPIKIGPWKFNGLPGLIFEIYDETKTYSWYLTGIREEKFEEVVFNVPVDKCEHISIRKFADIQYINTSSIQSKLPKGVRIQTSNPNGRELKFEWEEQ